MHKVTYLNQIINTNKGEKTFNGIYRKITE